MKFKEIISKFIVVVTLLIGTEVCANSDLETFVEHYNSMEFEKAIALIQIDIEDRDLDIRWLSSLYDEYGKIETFKQLGNSDYFAVRKEIPKSVNLKKPHQFVAYAVQYSDQKEGFIETYLKQTNGRLFKIDFAFDILKKGQAQLGRIWARTEDKSPSKKKVRLWFSNEKFEYNSLYFFPGILSPPKCHIYLPDSFIIERAKRPIIKDKDAPPSVADGVIWTIARTAYIFRDGKELDLRKIKDPLFYAKLDSNVGQIPGKNEFSHEKKIKSLFSQSGVKNIKVLKYDWSGYPVLALHGKRPDGSLIRTAWIGMNTNEGWSIHVDYRMPNHDKKPKKAHIKIWDDFLKLSGD